MPAALQQSLQCPLLGAAADAMRCAVAPRLHRQRRAQEPVGLNLHFLVFRLLFVYVFFVTIVNNDVNY